MNYVPNNLSELIGRNDEIKKIKEWLINFYNPESEQKNALFIEGSPGIGKSILLEYILNDLLFDVYRVDGCQFKNIKTFRDHCNNIMHSKNVLMMLNKNIKKAIFIDELEAIVSTDKMIVSELMSFINEHNIKKRGRTKKKKIVRNSNPIICICHPIKNKKIKELMNDCDVINLKNIVPYELYNFIKGILEKEGKQIDNSQIYDIINLANGDLRKIYEIIQNLLLLDNNDIKNKDISNFNKKEIDLSLNNILDILYFRKKINIDDFLYYFDFDKVNIPLMYYENMLNYIECNKSDNFEKIDKIYELFSSSNTIESYIFNEQKWLLNNFLCLESIIIPNNIVNTLNDKKNAKLFFIKFTIVLSKTSLRYYNIKILKNISDKMGIYIDEFYDIIAYFISLLNNKNYDKLVYLLKLYHLEVCDFEKMIKLYYSDCELSNEIKNGLKMIIL